MLINLIESNRLAFQYHVSTSREVNEICMPLNELGIPLFSYMKIFKDGSYLRVSNHFKFGEAYLANVRELGTFYTSRLNRGIKTSVLNNEYNFFLIPQNIIPLAKDKGEVLNLLNEFSVRNVLTAVKISNDNFFESYSFANPNLYAINAAQFYLNNTENIKRFISYFHFRAAEIIDTTDKDKLARMNQTFCLPHKSVENTSNIKLKQFLEKTQINQITLKQRDNKYVTLTQRETESLRYLAQGYSLKEIAAVLGLSMRTIECYINNVKQKTGFYSRSKLIGQLVDKNNYPKC